MPPTRPCLASLLFTALLLTAFIILADPPSASAQVTHSGIFSLTPGNSQVGTYKVGGQPDNLIFTVCVTGGDDVEVLADGAPAPGMGFIGTHGCKTRRLTANKLVISIVGGGSGTSQGTYSLSLSFP